MIRKEKHLIECPCPRAKRFEIVLQYEDGKRKGSKTRELQCPYCEDLLTVELPGTVVQSEQVFRSMKKMDEGQEQ